LPQLQRDTERLPEIFDIKNENKSIDFLKECIDLSDQGEKKRISSPAPSIHDHILTLFGGLPKCFTEIVIENVNGPDFEEMANPGFVNDLRQLLPLLPEENDPFLSKIKDPHKLDELNKIFSSPDFFPSIEVYLGIKDERQLNRIYKYFPEFKTELEFKEADIEVGMSKSNKFAYYIIHTTQDLERSEKEGSETGFWVRNQNFLVKGADFFEKPGSRKKYIHEPLKNWMYGEIFHKDMNEFITVARNDYIWESKEFDSFKSEVIDLIVDLNKSLRKAWRQKNEIIGTIVKPFEELSSAKGPFLRCNKTFESMGIKSDGPDADAIFNQLQSRRKPELEDDSKRVDILLKGHKNPITLADDEDILIQIDPSVSETIGYIDSYDAELERTIVLISPGLFSPREVIFLGKTFNVYFVVDDETAPAISINKDTSNIYINAFNNDLINYTISFIDILIAIEIADSMTVTKEEMKDYLLKLLGWSKNMPSVADYFGPLADDLMRRRMSRK
jgi:hypothetical protein